MKKVLLITFSYLRYLVGGLIISVTLWTTFNPPNSQKDKQLDLGKHIAPDPVTPEEKFSRQTGKVIGTIAFVAIGWGIMFAGRKKGP